MTANNSTTTEKLLYKLILQFAIYTRGSNKQLDPCLFNITEKLKKNTKYQELTPELLALSKTLHHITRLEGQSEEQPPSTTLIQKEFINRLITLLSESNIPLKFKKKFSQLQQKSKIKLNHQDSNRLIEMALALIIEIKDHAISEQQDIENFLKEMSNQFNELEKHTSLVSSSNEQSIENRDNLNSAITLQVDNIKTCSSSAKDLPSLQESIDQHTQELNRQLIKHKKIEIDHHIRTKQQIDSMSQKIHEMEIEADTLRNNLKITRDKALRDPLTGLANRAAYDERALIEYYRWYRYKNDLSFIIWDIDFFKKINDTFGHKAGDRTLSLVAQLIFDNCRESDFIARFGGEEFVVILPNTNAMQALELANKTRINIANSGFNHNGKTIKLTISCGISEFTDNDELDSVFERADQALYQSKENGRNCCTIKNK